MPPLIVVTSPVAEPTVAIEGVPLLHTPPGAASDNETSELTHAVVAPVIAPALGSGFTVSVVLTAHEPIVYVIAVVPTDTPFAIPDAEPMVATAGVALVQIPPVTASDNVVLLPIQTEGKEGMIAVGVVLIVIDLVAMQPKAV